MDSSYKNILEKVFELEGLLLLAEEKGGNAAPLLISTIKEKAKEVSCLTDTLDHNPISEHGVEIILRKEQEAESFTEADLNTEQSEPEFVEISENKCIEQTLEKTAEDEDDFEIADDEDYQEENEEEEVYEEEEIAERNLNLRQAFSINDKYRFRRELFGNDALEMNSTLDRIQTMDTFDEVEDYIYNEKKWDSESIDVEDFMNIIKRNFNA